MEKTVLSVASRAVVEAFESLGFDGQLLLKKVGIDPAQVRDPDARISASQADALWQTAYSLSGDPLLSLHAAEALPFGAYKVIDYLASTAETIGHGIEAVCRYFPLIDARASLEVQQRGSRAYVLFQNVERAVPLPPPAQEYTLLALVMRSRVGTQINWTPHEVHFTFLKPDQIGEYERTFNAKLCFGKKVAGLVIKIADWQRKSKGSDPSLHEVLEQHARTLFEKRAPEEASLEETVKQTVASALIQGVPSLESASKKLGLGAKTLQRRLREKNTSFGKIIEDVRYERAVLYLNDRSIALSEVSFLLGFSDQSAFTRAFKRWSGKSPNKWRQSGSF